MTTTVDFSTVTNSIAALTFTGASGTITVKDIHEIASTIGLDDHILSPMPENFISGVEITRDEMTAQLLVLKYILTYRYYHCKLGGDLFANYANMVTNAASILLAFASDVTLAGAVDNGEAQITAFGPVNDPAGIGYHGFDLTLNITQFLEV